jgi:hypothetical protein
MSRQAEASFYATSAPLNSILPSYSFVHTAAATAAAAAATAATAFEASEMTGSTRNRDGNYHDPRSTSQSEFAQTTQWLKGLVLQGYAEVEARLAKKQRNREGKSVVRQSSSSSNEETGIRMGTAAKEIPGTGTTTSLRGMQQHDSRMNTVNDPTRNTSKDVAASGTGTGAGAIRPQTYAPKPGT